MGNRLPGAQFIRRCSGSPAYFLPALVLFFLLLVLIILFHQGPLRAAGDPDGLIPDGEFPEPPTPAVAPPPASPPISPAPPASTPLPSSASSQPLPTANSTAASGEPVGPGEYDFLRPVPAAETSVTEEYFESAVFIGDSRTEGLKMFGGPQNAAYYTSSGLKVDTVFTRPVVRTAAGEKVTVIEALRQKPFKKVYIMLGINELGWAYSDLFIDKYAAIIDEIKTIAPEAQIYLQSLLPVTKERSQSDGIFNNANIGRYNDLIQQMAAEKGLYYLNVAQCMSDTEGFLFSDASTDGIHLKKDYCELWFDYLRRHYVAE